jgi:hypothetical protein
MIDEDASPPSDKPESGQVSSSANPEGEQVSGQTDRPKFNIDRRRGFDLENIIKHEASTSSRAHEEAGSPPAENAEK